MVSYAQLGLDYAFSRPNISPEADMPEPPWSVCHVSTDHATGEEFDGVLSSDGTYQYTPRMYALRELDSE